MRHSCRLVLLGFLLCLPTYAGAAAPEALGRLLAPHRRAHLVARLVAGLGSIDPDTVTVCIDTLGALRERSAVPQLIDCLHDQFEFYRYYAMKALGHIGDMCALPALQQAAEFDVSRVAEVEPRGSGVGRVVLRDVAKVAVEEVRAAQHAPPLPEQGPRT
jgi:hypothetical protein